MIKSDVDHAIWLLQVSPSATPEEIQRAYRVKVSQTHPDRGGNAAEFQQVRSAKLVLDEWKKSQGQPEEIPAIKPPRLIFSTTWLIAAAIGALAWGFVIWVSAPWAKMFAVLLLLSWIIACLRWSVGHIPLRFLWQRLNTARKSQDSKQKARPVAEKI